MKLPFFQETHRSDITTSKKSVFVVRFHATPFLVQLFFDVTVFDLMTTLAQESVLAQSLNPFSPIRSQFPQVPTFSPNSK